MATREEAAYFAALEAAFNFRPKPLRELIAREPDIAKAVALIEKEEPRLRSELEIACETAFGLMSEWSRDIAIIRKNEVAYPPGLTVMSSSPEFLFVRGDASLLSRPGLSLVGSRGATEPGCQRAEKLARLALENGFTVVSGLARGIDTAAHLGALKAGGKTIAVIGTPIHKFYPKENRKLQERIGEEGAVISQFGPLRPTQRLNFPQRNEVMSALTRATVIVEAGETSGALIQARHALRQGRPLFILQNQIERCDLEWPRDFLKKGALALDDFSLLLDELKKTAPVQRRFPDLD
jgi:DNA processing protein